jgi:hypothetical protein
MFGKLVVVLHGSKDWQSQPARAGRYLLNAGQDQSPRSKVIGIKWPYPTARSLHSACGTPEAFGVTPEVWVERKELTMAEEQKMSAAKKGREDTLMQTVPKLEGATGKCGQKH